MGDLIIVAKRDELLKYIKNNNGVIRASEAVKAGFRRELLRELVDAGDLEKETRGVYALPNCMVDTYFLLQQRCPKGVFSYGTALYFHNLSDRTPNVLHLTVPQGYGTGFLKDEFPNVQYHYVYPEFLNIGVETVKTPIGHMVRAYNPERCICDLLKARRSKVRGIDSQIFSGAMTGYFQSKSKDLHKLTKYASVFGVEKDLRTYTEVFLPW